MLNLPRRFSMWTLGKGMDEDGSNSVSNSVSRGFSRQEYYSGLPCPPPGDLPDSGVEPEPLSSPELAGRFSSISATWVALKEYKLQL